MFLIDLAGLIIAGAIFAAGYITGNKTTESQIKAKLTDLKATNSELQQKLIEKDADIQGLRADNEFAHKLLTDREKQ